MLYVSPVRLFLVNRGAEAIAERSFGINHVWVLVVNRLGSYRGEKRSPISNVNVFIGIHEQSYCWIHVLPVLMLIGF